MSMREKLLLIGAGSFGRVVLEHAESKYDCAFLDDGHEIGAFVDGIPVVGKIEDLGQFFPEYQLLLVTIGNSKLRQTVYEKAKDIGYSFPNIIVPSAYISPRATIGDGVIILNNAVVQNHATIGSGTILTPGVEAHQDSSIGKCCLIYTNSVVRSLAELGDRVSVGSTVTISTGAKVPDDEIIPDGSVFKAKQE